MKWIVWGIVGVIEWALIGVLVPEASWWDTFAIVAGISLIDSFARGFITGWERKRAHGH